MPRLPHPHQERIDVQHTARAAYILPPCRHSAITKQLGGLPELERRDLEKAAMLYDAIDSSRMFRGTVTDPTDRSIMNACFVMKEEYLNSKPISFASAPTAAL